MSTESRTNKNNWLRLVFAILLALHLFALILPVDSLRWITKPLLIPALAAWFLTTTNNRNFGRWLLAALLFSWLGDVALLWSGSTFFMIGLGCFLVAHLFYIRFFHAVRMQELVAGRWWLLVIVALYYAALITLLIPFLGEMKNPVLVYGLVISLMLLIALHLLFIPNRQAGRWMAVGAVLFVLSDSLLAIDKFYSPFTAAAPLIMLTYGLAQYCIVEGARRFIAGLEK